MVRGSSKTWVCNIEMLAILWQLFIMTATWSICLAMLRTWFLGSSKTPSRNHTILLQWLCTTSHDTCAGTTRYCTNIGQHETTFAQYHANFQGFSHKYLAKVTRCHMTFVWHHVTPIWIHPIVISIVRFFTKIMWNWYLWYQFPMGPRLKDSGTFMRANGNYIPEVLLQSPVRVGRTTLPQGNWDVYCSCPKWNMPEVNFAHCSEQSRQLFWTSLNDRGP